MINDELKELKIDVRNTVDSIRSRERIFGHKPFIGLHERLTAIEKSISRVERKVAILYEGV